MKKRSFSIFLISILVISCFLYVFPLISFADSYADNIIPFSYSSGSYNTSISSINDVAYSTGISIDNSSWFQRSFTSGNQPLTIQLPIPISSLNYLQYTTDYYYGDLNFDSSTRTFNFITTGFNLSFNSIISSLNPSTDSFIGMAFPFLLRSGFDSLSYNFVSLVTGNQYTRTSYYFDDRFLVYNPYSLDTFPTSSIIDVNLYSMPYPLGSEDTYICVFLC